MERLLSTLKNIDGKGYKGYKSLHGTYSFDKFKLAIDYVQGDPFAAPSKIRIIIPDKFRPIQEEWKQNRYRKLYAEDLIAREVARGIHKNADYIKGSGKSGLIMIDAPGQEIIERTAVTIKDNQTIICLSVGLPANGRRINGKQAEKLFAKSIPDILNHSIFYIKDSQCEEVVQLADQHRVIRQEMEENNWISFIANDSILPRESGVSNRPMKHAVPFQSPKENEVTITIPHRQEALTGMAIKKGISLIVGGGYHGKSTLLNAIERGVYNHIKGDGREYVLTDPSAVKIRAEDGRSISNVNISPFINHLPHGVDTTSFSTDNASGSTSQAANVMEALEAGATTLLIDEDTSATNFMIRDERMQALVTKEKEPITPFIDKVVQLKNDFGVSTILVMGGSGDYFDIADQVIMLEQYLPHNVTQKAKEIAAQYPFKRKQEGREPFEIEQNRRFLTASLDSQKGKRSKVQAKGKSLILMGKSEIHIDYLEQLADTSQTRMIAELILFLEQNNWLTENIAFSNLLDKIEEKMNEQGLASFTKRPNEHPGELARPRRFEIAATLNRIRRAKVSKITT